MFRTAFNLACSGLPEKLWMFQEGYVRHSRLFKDFRKFSITYIEASEYSVEFDLLVQTFREKVKPFLPESLQKQIKFYGIFSRHI